MSHATQAFTDLVLRQLQAAADEGLLSPADPERDAWFVTKLVMGVYHHYAFAAGASDADDIGEQLWSFCLGALGGTTT
jgi:TetR/AcrR family transcriptional regulator